MEYEKNIKDYPKSISLEGSETILEQMKKKVCIIIIGKQKGIGFFCNISFKDNNSLSALIAYNDLIDESILKTKIKKWY